MNLGFAFFILFVICAATVGMIFVAANANSNATTDSYNRTNTVHENLTRGNVTALAPVGINIMGYVAIIVAVLVVVISIGAIIVYSNRGYGSRR